MRELLGTALTLTARVSESPAPLLLEDSMTRSRFLSGALVLVVAGLITPPRC
jgi:hypothetical protein